MNETVPVRIMTGAPVRIDGKEFSAGPVISGGRVFFDKEAGTQLVISEIAQMRMALDLRLRDNATFEKLSSARRHALRIDWGTFTPQERHIALSRALYVRKVDKVQPALQRSKKKVLKGIIKAIGDARKVPEDKRPSPRQLRTWYRIFVTAGRDVRALVPCNWAKGYRHPRYQEWQIELIDALINKKIATPTASSFIQVKLLADAELKKEAARRGETLKLYGEDKQNIGTNLVSRLLARRDRFDVLCAQTNPREARRQMESIQLGPQGDEVNKEWEVDHTLLDIIVIDEVSGQIAGRPWMTTIIDRYSRCIVGFSLSFAPPSWASVMDALRVAISRKDWILEGLQNITNKWDCYGPPKVLITDHGRDFKSNSMEEASRAIGFDLRHMKPRKPWLKGKIERWFKTFEEEIVHTLPGTVFSKWEGREFYNSEKFAVLTINEVNWIAAKYVVDVYQQRRHSKIGMKPAEKWKRGLHSIPTLREFDENLLVPMMGLLIPRTLRTGGIFYMGLRWDSPEFSKVRALLPDSSNVQARLDPLDITTIYVFDEIRKKWVEGELVEPVEARGWTLDQWIKVKRVRKRIQDEDDVDERAALAQAIKEIDDYVAAIKDRRIKSKAPKRMADFRKRTAWSAIHGSRRDTDHSAPIAHEIGITRIKSPPIQNHGPYEESSTPHDEVDPEDNGKGRGDGKDNSKKSRKSKKASPREQDTKVHVKTPTDDGPVVVAEAVIREPGFKIPTDDDLAQEKEAAPKTKASETKGAETKASPPKDSPRKTNGDREDNTVRIKPVDYED
jgi:putative transposase